MEQAAKDFPEGQNGRNVIVLITDGQESCGYDPCEVSQRLQDEGIILKPYVVGFGLSYEEEQKVKCIGTYYSAKNRDALSNALKSIMVEVVSPPSLEVQVWAGGTNVTRDAEVQVIDSSGKAITLDSKSVAGGTLTATLGEGVYTVQARLKVGNEVRTVSQSGVELKKDTTTRVRLDFGDLRAVLEVSVVYGTQDLTTQSALEVIRDGKTETSFGKGNDVFRFRTDPGTIDLKAIYSGDSKVEKKLSGVTLKAGETTRVIIDLGDVLGILRVRVVAGEADVTQEAKVQVRGEKATLDPVQRGPYREALVPPDVYGVKAWYKDVESSTVETEVKAGQVTEITVKLDLPGKIVLVLKAGDQPIPPSKILTRIKGAGLGSDEFSAFQDTLVAVVKPGVYSVQATYTSDPEQTRTIENIEVKSGQTVEVPVVYEKPGRIRVKLIENDKPSNNARIKLYKGEKYLRDLDQIKEEKGLFEAGVLEGTYRLQVIPSISGFEEKWIENIQVKAGRIVEKQVELSATKIRVELISDGKPYSGPETRAELYKHDPDAGSIEAEEWVCYLNQLEKGVFEAKVKEGAYDLHIYNLGKGCVTKPYASSRFPEAKP